MDRLKRKMATAAEAVPEPLLRLQPGATAGVISIGGCHGAVNEAIDRLAARGVVLDYMRIKAFPFGTAVKEFLAAHDRCFVVEQNRDAQLRSLLMIETGVASERLIPVLEYGGLPLTADFVVDAVSPPPRAAASGGSAVGSSNSHPAFETAFTRADPSLRSG